MMRARWKYGGYGYHRLLVNVVPRLRAKGVDDAGLWQLLVENPAGVRVRLTCPPKRCAEKLLLDPGR